MYDSAMTARSGGLSDDEISEAVQSLENDRRPWPQGLLSQGVQARLTLTGPQREVLWSAAKAEEEMSDEGLDVSKEAGPIPFEKSLTGALDVAGSVDVVLNLVGFTYEKRVEAFRKLARHVRAVTGYATWEDNYPIFAACALADYLDGLQGAGRWSLTREVYRRARKLLVIDAVEAGSGHRHILVMHMDDKFEIRPADDALRVQVAAGRL